MDAGGRSRLNRPQVAAAGLPAAAACDWHITIGDAMTRLIERLYRRLFSGTARRADQERARRLREENRRLAVHNETARRREAVHAGAVQADPLNLDDVPEWELHQQENDR